jgi:fibulin 1/2
LFPSVFQAPTGVAEATATTAIISEVESMYMVDETAIMGVVETTDIVEATPELVLTTIFSQVLPSPSPTPVLTSLSVSATPVLTGILPTPTPQPIGPKCEFPYGTEAGDEQLPLTDDVCSDMQDTDCRPIPAFGQIITKFYICENGVVGTEYPFQYSNPQLFPGDSRINGKNQIVFAPYWVNIDTRQEGYIWYGSHDKDDENNVTIKADDLVHQLSPDHSDFKTEAVYVATWENVPNFPDGNGIVNDEKSSLRNTFQAAVITDFHDTFLMYCYMDIKFTGRYGNAVVGYSAGNNEQVYNHDGSLTEDILQVGQFKTGNFTGLLFFPLTATESAQTNADILCHEWYCQDQDQFGVRPRWEDFSFPCPWTGRHAAVDFRYISSQFSNNRQCYAQSFPTSVVDSVSGELLTVETECCYRGGVLNLGSPFGGGSSPYHRLLQTDLYSRLTAQPYTWCCIESDNCHLYFERRPSRSSQSYFPLFWGWGFGDPHIQTLDGKTYTFNGYGEYILMKTTDESFVLQGRAEQVGTNSTATVFTAFSMAQFPASGDFVANDASSTVLHVQLGANNNLEVYANHIAQMTCMDLTSNFTSLSNTSSLTLDNVTILRPNNDTFQAIYGSDISIRVEAQTVTLSITFAGSMDLMGQTRGLFGVWDENSDNDFTARNGTILPPDSSDRIIHFEFGLSWQVLENESLFCYPSGLGLTNLSFPEMVPLFLDEVNLTSLASPDVIAVCGGDLGCLFDGFVTGDPVIASETLIIQQRNEQEASIIANVPPLMNGSDTLFAFVNQTTTYLFTVTDVNDTFTVVLQGNPPPQEEYIFLNLTQSDGVYNFTWTPTSTSHVSIQFLATDSTGAATLLHPLVRLCACHQELNATCTEATGDAGEDKFLIQGCDCGLGYGGTFCNEDINGCDEADCFPGVECTDNPAPLTGVTCGECPNGTVATNNSCTDVNECMNNSTNDCEHNCNNILSSFSCSCNAGFMLNDDGKSCDGQ